MTRWVTFLVVFSCSVLQAQENTKQEWQKSLKDCNKILSSLKDKEVSIDRQEKALINFEILLSKGDKKMISENRPWIEIMSLGTLIQVRTLQSCGTNNSTLSKKTEKLRKENQISFKKEKEVLMEVMSPADVASNKLESLLRRMNSAIVQAGGHVVEASLVK